MLISNLSKSCHCDFIFVIFKYISSQFFLLNLMYLMPTYKQSYKSISLFIYPYTLKAHLNVSRDLNETFSYVVSLHCQFISIDSKGR